MEEDTVVIPDWAWDSTIPLSEIIIATEPGSTRPGSRGFASWCNLNKSQADKFGINYGMGNPNGAKELLKKVEEDKMKRYKLKKDTPAFKAGTECYIEEAGHMVPCRGISYTIVHKDQLEKNPNILTDWFEEIKEPTRWKPEIDEEYYCLGKDGSVTPDEWTGISIDNDRFDIGNCFQTEEEAERAAEYLKALSVVRGDATSEFVKYNDNWFIGYDPEHKSIDAFCNPYTARNGIFGLPYFATKEDAQRSIEQHRNEWLTIFGVKEEE